MDEPKKNSDKVEAKSQPKPAEKPAAKVMIHTNFGRMVDPTTGEIYDRKPTELVKRTGWVDSQLEAKKMSLV